MKILCKLGIHRPLLLDLYNTIVLSFYSPTSGEAVNFYRCPCKKLWMSDGGKWFGSKCLCEEMDAKSKKLVDK